ncbi:iron uptake protein [Sphaerotilaceae bacterium SBD11-9]
MARSVTPPSATLVLGRVIAGLVGGWGFTWGFVTLGITALVAAGLPYGDARTLLYLLAFLVFLGLFLWAFAAASLARVWGVLAGGGAAMTLAAWLLARTLA